MKLKTMVLLAMALGCGLVAMVGVQQVLAERKSSGGNKVSVLVARMEIDAGAELKEENVAFEEREVQTVPQGAVTDAEQYKRRATTVRLFPGELILQAKMGEPGVIGVAAQIPKGMRVVAVPVNATSSISGMVTAGNKVDIVLTYARQKNGVQFKKTKTILTNIEIFSVDKVRHQDSADASKASAKPENVSLLVTPQQAQTLSYATQNGQLQLTLRSTTDDVAVETTEIDDEAFEGIDTDEGVKVSEEDPRPRRRLRNLSWKCLRSRRRTPGRSRFTMAKRSEWKRSKSFPRKKSSKRTQRLVSRRHRLRHRRRRVERTWAVGCGS